MAITKFVRAEFDRAVQEELFDINFIGFGEGLVTVFYKIQRHVKTHTNPMGIIARLFISSVLVVPGF